MLVLVKCKKNIGLLLWKIFLKVIHYETQTLIHFFRQNRGMWILFLRGYISSFHYHIRVNQSFHTFQDYDNPMITKNIWHDCPARRQLISVPVAQFPARRKVFYSFQPGSRYSHSFQPGGRHSTPEVKYCSLLLI